MVNRCSLDDAVQEVKGKGFDLLTMNGEATSQDPEPSIEALAGLISQLKRTYDFVVLDTAPVLFVADSLRSAPLADKVLFLVKQKTTNSRSSIRATKMLREAGTKRISAAMTVTEPDSERDTFGSFITHEY